MKCVVEIVGYGDIEDFEITNDMTERDIDTAIWESVKEFLSLMDLVSCRIEEEDEK